MKKLTTWLLVLLLFTYLIPTFIPVVKASPSTWFVATTGSDTTGDGSIGNPFASLWKALNVSGNGDTIYMREGTYIPKSKYYGLIKKTGTTAQPFTISAYNGETVIINGSSIPSLSGGYGVFTISGSYNNITLYGLSFEACPTNGFLFVYQYSNDIKVQHCTFYNSTDYVMLFQDKYTTTIGYINNIEVSNCTMEKFQTAVTTNEGITFIGVKGLTFCYNTISDGHKIYVDLSNNTINGRLFKNRFYCNTSTQIANNNALLYLDAAQCTLPLKAKLSNISIYDNLIQNHNGTGLALCAGEKTGGSIDNITVYNNIIDMTYTDIYQSFGLVIERPQLHDNITVMYNTIYLHGSTGYPIYIDVEGDENFKNYVIANNIIHGAGSVSYLIRAPHTNSFCASLKLYNNLYYHTTKAANTYWLDGTNKFEATAIKADPEFMDLNVNFHLNSTSPAIDAATSSYNVDTDYDGVIRPQDTGYDIGAYEYKEQGSGDSVPPVISFFGTMISSPLDTLGGYGWENFSCVAIDNVEVSAVLLRFVNPDQSTTNVSMIKKTGTTTYYANRSLHQPGNYSNCIQATDTSNNVALTSNYTFSLPPNWDINTDGSCTILDLVLVSNHYDETGGHGWIREDTDNNGIVEVLDIVMVSEYYETSWWV